MARRGRDAWTEGGLRSHMVLLIQMRSVRSGHTVIAKSYLGFMSAELEKCSDSRPRRGPHMVTTGHKSNGMDFATSSSVEHASYFLSA